jgi:hypothetical protein
MRALCYALQVVHVKAGGCWFFGEPPEALPFPLAEEPPDPFMAAAFSLPPLTAQVGALPLPVVRVSKSAVRVSTSVVRG